MPADVTGVSDPNVSAQPDDPTSPSPIPVIRHVADIPQQSAGFFQEEGFLNISQINSVGSAVSDFLEAPAPVFRVHTRKTNFWF